MGLSYFLLAFLLFIAVGSMGVNKYAPIIGKISENSPAFEAGIQENDRIVMINGVLIEAWEDVSTHIQESVGKLELKIERAGSVQTLIITPKINEYQNMFGEIKQKKMIGIAPSGKMIEVSYSADKVIGFAYDQTIKATTLILTSLQKLVEGVVSPKELGGIISIVQVTSEASDAGIIALFTLTALISVNLGVLNLLPIPALDGGHIMFNMYEMLTRRAPSERIVYMMTLGGWAVLLTLMVFTIFNDIYRLTGGQ